MKNPKHPGECPECGCPHITHSVRNTLDAYNSWQDDDGDWHRGPARKSITMRCGSGKCSWTDTWRYEHGKFVGKDEPK